MQILHVINNLGGGGAEKLIVNTLPKYKNNGFDVEVLVLTHTNSINEYTQTLIDSNIKVHNIASQNLYNPIIVFSLWNFFRSHKYDIIHIHLFPAMYWVTMALPFSPKKLIFTEHNTTNNRWNKAYLYYPDYLIYSKFTDIIAITDEVKENLIKWMPSTAKKITTIRNGIDTASIKSIKVLPRQELLKMLSLVNNFNGKILLMTARFNEQKDQMTLVRAMTFLPENYLLLMVGEGNLQQNVKDLANDLKIKERVYFLGFRKDAISLMKSVDINILSTNHEGLSGVTLESLASERPFLGSDVPGVSNVVPDNRFLFERGNPEDLAMKIKFILESDNEALNQLIGDAKKFVKNFELDKMIMDHIRVYSSVS